MNKAKGHPFRSTFVPNGEESRPLPREGNRRAAVEGYRLSRSLGRPPYRSSLSRQLTALVLALTTTAATAAVGPDIRTVQPADLTSYWVMTNTSLNVDVPNSGVNLSKPPCSAVPYMIGADGVPRDIVVRKTIPAGDLTTVAASAVKDMRYVAGSKNPAHEPVFTYLVIPFNLPADPAERKKITDACVLKDFPRGYR